MSEDRRHRLGALGEQLASEHLERRGFAILERNYRTRYGELDIVAFDGQVIAFVEVKTRRGGDGASPFEAIRPAKRARIRKMASSWLIDRRGARPFAKVMRFDAIGVSSIPPAGCSRSSTWRARSKTRRRSGQSASASCWYAVDWNDSRCSGETPSRAIASRCSGVE